MQLVNLRPSRDGGPLSFRRLRETAALAAEIAVRAQDADPALPGRIRAIPFRADSFAVHAKAAQDLLVALASGIPLVPVSG